MYRGVLKQSRYSGVVDTLNVALKIVKTSAGVVDRATFLQEAARMRILEHENVLRLVGVNFRSEPIFIAVEYCSGGDLKDYLRKCRADPENPVRLSECTQVWCALEICRGLAYLATKGYVHRDIAARNILIYADWSSGEKRLKIGDFGGNGRGVFLSPLIVQFVFPLTSHLFRNQPPTRHGA